MIDTASYRTEMDEMGVPDSVSDWWLGVNRPGVLLGQSVEGPIAGQLGGVPLLPADFEWPVATAASLGSVIDLPVPFVASVDCAALPREGLDIDLPEDGHLLFFSFIDDFGPHCRVAYVPAGTVLTERAAPLDEQGDPPESLPLEQLRATAGLTFVGTEHGYPEQTGPGEIADANTLKRLEALTDTPGDPIFQVGGHPYVIQSDPEGESEGQYWILLAQMFLWKREYPDIAGDIVYWTIPREDLAAGRFDRAEVTIELGG